jgi:hypothetical protein
MVKIINVGWCNVRLSLETTMRDIVNLEIVVIEALNKTGVVGRELQILNDGLPSKTINIADLNLVNMKVPDVDISTTITIELRDIDSIGTMSSPLVYEFVVTDGMPQPESEFFKVFMVR